MADGNASTDKVTDGAATAVLAAPVARTMSVPMKRQPSTIAASGMKRTASVRPFGGAKQLPPVAPLASPKSTKE